MGGALGSVGAGGELTSERTSFTWPTHAIPLFQALVLTPGTVRRLALAPGLRVGRIASLVAGKRRAGGGGVRRPGGNGGGWREVYPLPFLPHIHPGDSRMPPSPSPSPLLPPFPPPRPRTRDSASHCACEPLVLTAPPPSVVAHVRLADNSFHSA